MFGCDDLNDAVRSISLEICSCMCDHSCCCDEEFCEEFRVDVGVCVSEDEREEESSLKLIFRLVLKPKGKQTYARVCQNENASTFDALLFDI